jgi:tetratricopeptide (TPR) repeat protein
MLREQVDDSFRRIESRKKSLKSCGCEESCGLSTTENEMEELWQKYSEGKYGEVIQLGLKQMADNRLADIMHLVGLSLVHEQKLVGARSLLTTASILVPQPEWFCNACVVLLEADPEASLKFAIDGLSKHSNNPELLKHKGNALLCLGDKTRLREAIDCFDQHLATTNSVDVILSKANCYLDLADPLTALACYEEVLQNDPASIIAALGKGRALMDMGNAEAEIWLEKGLGLIPEYDVLYGMLKLGQGDYDTGWKYYQRRWDCKSNFFKSFTRIKPFPNSLEEIKGKTVLITGEQGMGDRIQFIRFLPLLEQHAKVIVLAHPSLERLFKHMYPTTIIVTERPSEDAYDYEIGMMDQPFLLGTTLETIPSEPYVHFPNGVSYPSADMFDYKTRKSLRVGICWAGQNNTEFSEIDARRSIDLHWMLPLLDEGASFVSLQIGQHVEEMENPIFDFFDYMDTAGVISELDLVITVDTSVAHLAAAMGKPVWLLSRHAGCWRWLQDRSDSPWYPTLRIYRQPPPASGEAFSTDWASVVEQVRADLEQLIESNEE